MPDTLCKPPTPLGPPLDRQRADPELDFGETVRPLASSPSALSASESYPPRHLDPFLAHRWMFPPQRETDRFLARQARPWDSGDVTTLGDRPSPPPEGQRLAVEPTGKTTERALVELAI